MSLHSTLAAALLAVSVLLAAAAPLRRQDLQLKPVQLKPVRVAEGLLQSIEDKKGPAFGTQWFAEDAQRIAQMPPYITDQKHPVCNPMCTYSCGKSECDQTCEPLCLPPKCETLCAKSEDKCETRCNKPKCAVICPLQAECAESGGCPKNKCRTICAPPACTTSCSGSCHSVCTQPQCNWKCKVGKCPKPECKLSCPKGNCATKFPNPALFKVPLMPGMDIKSNASASLDPKVLLEPVEAPPPPGPQTIPQPFKESSRGSNKIPGARTTPSPVKKLKMRWEAEDLHAQNERLLRR